MIRIGQGVDFHRFVAGDGLILGGIFIPEVKSVDAHSDGDVVLHAVMDSILGALALGDIGEFFPDDDDTYLDADSTSLLIQILHVAKDKGFVPVNLDITIICEFPKIKKYRKPMRQNIGKIINLSEDRISIKATTTEKMGFIGRGEGIGVMVSILMEQTFNV